MPVRVCWNCRAIANQKLRGDPLRESSAAPNHSVWWYGFYQCDNCGHASVGATQLAPGATTSGAKGTLDGGVDRWLPEFAPGRNFPDVPAEIGTAASEAYSSFAVGAHRAAILMARSVVEAVAKDNGITTGALKSKIDKLESEKLIRPVIKDAAHEIRFLGNEMAHGDFVEPVEADEAEDVLNLMSAVLEDVYQIPARVNAQKAARLARNTPGST